MLSAKKGIIPLKEQGAESSLFHKPPNKNGCFLFMFANINIVFFCVIYVLKFSTLNM